MKIFMEKRKFPGVEEFGWCGERRGVVCSYGRIRCSGCENQCSGYQEGEGLVGVVLGSRGGG